MADSQTGTYALKVGLAQMLKGGVIMDVTTAEEARIAEEAGAVAVMALERVPADIRKEGGVARMSDPTMIRDIKKAVTIPVMAKARIGHFVEAQILEALEVDYVDESEVLTPADDIHHINKHNFKTLDDDELYVYAKEIRAPVDLVRKTKHLGRLPVVNFAAGGVASPADAALMMQMGVDGVFVGSGIFKSGDPAKRARAIVQAVTHYNDPKILAEVSCGLGEAMVGIDCRTKDFNSYAARSE
ncbi:hypothetical protein WJX79_008855 [Trebouxia sp. C0005]